MISLQQLAFLFSNHTNPLNCHLQRSSSIHVRVIHLNGYNPVWSLAHKSKLDNISSTSHDVLHWLLIPHCIEYKLCTLHGVAPIYLSVSDNLIHYHLHVVTWLFLPQGQHTTVSAAMLVSLSLTYSSLCRQLKTFLLDRTYSPPACSWPSSLLQRANITLPWVSE